MCQEGNAQARGYCPLGYLFLYSPLKKITKLAYKKQKTCTKYTMVPLKHTQQTAQDQGETEWKTS